MQMTIPEAGEYGATAAATRFQAAWQGYAARNAAQLRERRHAAAAGTSAKAMRAYREQCAALGYGAEITEAIVAAALAETCLTNTQVPVSEKHRQEAARLRKRAEFLMAQAADLGCCPR